MSQPETTLQRTLPHPVLETVWMWSIFSEEKGLYFNGYALKTAHGLILIDPPAASDGIFKAIEALGTPHSILLTNRDHERTAQAFHLHFQIPVTIHANDAPLLETPPDRTFHDGDTLPGGLTALHLPDQKSPGECAFFQPEQGLLFLGDALIGKPAGQLSMLLPEKYADPVKAAQGLKRLQTITDNLKAILLGDGESLVSNPAPVLEAFFSRQT